MNSDNEYVSIYELRNAFKSVTGDCTCPLHIAATIDQILDFVPSADVVNVKHGRWEPGNSICPVCGEDKFNGLDADIWSDWTPKYCPNCGALMDLKEETEFGTTL